MHAISQHTVNKQISILYVTWLSSCDLLPLSPSFYSYNTASHVPTPISLTPYLSTRLPQET